MTDTTYDFIAVGLGPFNLSLACLCDNIDGLQGLFFEKSAEFDWHPGMMLESATLQTPFLSDLVTMADPTHPLSFLSYAKKMDKLYAFYIRESFFLMRKEYNQYCQWAAGQVSSIRFQHLVTMVEYDSCEKLYLVYVTDTKSNTQHIYRTPKLILGTGPAPYMPDCCDIENPNILHSGQYLKQKSDIQKHRRITLVGGGQSAAEIFYDLLQDIDQYNYQLNWLTRSPRYFPLEYTKLTLEMTSPEYVDYFYHLPSQTRQQLLSQQKHLYKGINSSLINDIYDLLYIKNLSNRFDINLLTNSKLIRHEPSAGSSMKLGFQQTESEKEFELETDITIMSTGYKYRMPDFLSGIHKQIDWNSEGHFAVGRNYSIDLKHESIFVQNAELHTHGFVTPDLGMACYRNAHIIRSITGKEHYPVETKIAFQHFDVPEKWQIQQSEENMVRV